MCTFATSVTSGVWELGGQIYYGFTILSSGSFGFKLQAIPSHGVATACGKYCNQIIAL